jgi:FKBP-type peptidyl-prolyl cis-trans isomerase
MIPAPEDVAAAPADATVTESGLAFKILSGNATDTRPGPTDKVTVHYTGWTAATGDMFDSSILRGEPATFGLNQVIAGWTEGLQHICPGQTARLWIPGDLAYGNVPQGGRPYGMLVFDVELISMIPGPKTPDVPADVAAAPADATVTASGLAYRVLSAGTGSASPKASQTVTVHYTGWMTNGQMFDSSVMRGETISFPLNRVIPGWTEGLQLMVAGEKTRFWIPGDLAYGNTPQGGRPHGTLVFDVELFSFS